METETEANCIGLIEKKPQTSAAELYHRHEAEKQRLIEASKYEQGVILSFRLNGQDVESIHSLTAPNSALAGPDGSEGMAAEIDHSMTAYNPSGITGLGHMLVRVEPLYREDNTETRFFCHNENECAWDCIPEAPVFERMQDPFYCGVIDGWHIFGGVAITPADENTKLIYQTVFYRFKDNIEELKGEDGKPVEPFARGPVGMKDIRLCQRQNGKIAVFTRPQGEKGGKGKIGYTEIDKLENLTPEVMGEAPIIEELFIDGQDWGGANQVFSLENGMIGVLGHIASESVELEGDVIKKYKHYYAITFAFDPENNKVHDLQIVATADDFPGAKSKNEALKDVVFSSSMERDGRGKAILYLGIGDRQAGYIVIPDPFHRFDEEINPYIDFS